MKLIKRFRTYIHEKNVANFSYWYGLMNKCKQNYLNSAVYLQKCTSRKIIAHFQVSIATFMGPFNLYFGLVYWVYPMKDYIGETGCHMVMFIRNVGSLAIHLYSFFMATFRYICLFHDNLLLKFNISPHVSNKWIWDAI